MSQHGNYEGKVEPKFIRNPALEEFNRRERKDAARNFDKRSKNSLKKR